MGENNVELLLEAIILFFISLLSAILNFIFIPCNFKNLFGSNIKQNFVYFPMLSLDNHLLLNLYQSNV